MGFFKRKSLRRTGINKIASEITGIRSQINDIVSGSNDIKVMLHHNDAVSFLQENIKGLEQFLNIIEMQAGSRLVKDKENLLIPGLLAVIE